MVRTPERLGPTPSAKRPRRTLASRLKIGHDAEVDRMKNHREAYTPNLAAEDDTISPREFALLVRTAANVLPAVRIIDLLSQVKGYETLARAVVLGERVPYLADRAEMAILLRKALAEEDVRRLVRGTAWRLLEGRKRGGKLQEGAEWSKEKIQDAVTCVESEKQREAFAEPSAEACKETRPNPETCLWDFGR